MDEDTIAQHILDSCSDYTLSAPGQPARQMWYRRAAAVIVQAYRAAIEAREEKELAKELAEAQEHYNKSEEVVFLQAKQLSEAYARLAVMTEAIGIYLREGSLCDTCYEDGCTAFGAECECGCHSEIEAAEIGLREAFTAAPKVLDESNAQAQ